MPDKNFTTYEQQIQLLIDRGINIASDDDKLFAKEVLKKVGYYSLINGYKDPFLDNKDEQNNEHYKIGTTLQEIHALYEFDRVLRETFLTFILKIETKVKSIISYYFSEEYGKDNYLIYTNFNTELYLANEKIPDLIAEINRQIASRAKDPCISHYLSNYGYIPLWVLNNILTFGTISKFYSLLKQKDQTKISREFKIQPHDLENFLKYLSPIRNFCAHGNRLFCYNAKKQTLNNTSFHQVLQIPAEHGNYVKGKNDLFAAVISLRILLSNNDYSRFKNKLKKSIYRVLKQLKTINRSELLDIMGFPDNWTNL